MALGGAYDDQTHHMVCVFTDTPTMWVDFRHLRITWLTLDILGSLIPTLVATEVINI